ncbi:hypothetical protein BDR06DRAFT_688300 [Suillus hirtellus]|nr:hypothetical protein BDR06DRAFT_688300 [Suillus hirtellus]
MWVGTPAPPPPHFHCSLSVSVRRSPLSLRHSSAYLRVPSAYLCLYSAFSNAYLPEPHTGEFCVLHLSCRDYRDTRLFASLHPYVRLLSPQFPECVPLHLIEQLGLPGVQIQNQQDLLYHGESNDAYWWSGRWARSSCVICLYVTHHIISYLHSWYSCPAEAPTYGNPGLAYSIAQNRWIQNDLVGARWDIAFDKS